MTEATPTGAGVPDIPYDRSAEEVPQMPLPGQPQEEQGLPQTPGAAPQQGAPGMLGEMGGSEAIPTDQLAGMVDVDPEAAQTEQIMAALEDPNTPPEVKAQIEQMIATAARRRMAGVVQ